MALIARKRVATGVSALLVLLLGWFVAEGLQEIQFDQRLTAYILTAVVLLVSAGPLIYSVKRKNLDLTYAAALLSIPFILHFVLGSVHALMFGATFLEIPEGSQNVQAEVVALLASILAITAFWLGYCLKFGEAVAQRLKPLATVWSRKRAIFYACILIVIGWAVRLALIIITAGSIGAYLTANKDQILLKFEGLTYLTLFTGLAPIGLLVLYIYGRVTKDNRLLIAAYILIVLELMDKVIAGSRNAAIFFILQLVVCNYLLSPRTPVIKRRYGRTTAVVMVVMLVFYPLATSLRVYGLSNPIKLFTEAPQFVTPRGLFWFMSERFHGHQSLGLVIKNVPDQVPFDNGMNIAMIGAAWIPRAVWPDKPIVSLGERFRTEMVPPGLYGDGASVAVTLPGNLYWSFGYLGIFFGMVFVGLLFKFLDTYFLKRGGNLSTILVWSVMVPSLLMCIEQDILYLLTYHVPLALLAIGTSKLIAKKELSAAV